ncbi:hypothetical protein VTO73DRAFT_15316 [Trametes versicolor]
MGLILSKLNKLLSSDLEEFTLPQLPFFSEDGVENSCLPLRPPSVCTTCWEGPFTMHLAIPLMSPRNRQWYRRWPKEVSYETSMELLQSRANAGCVWCHFILQCLNVAYPGVMMHETSITIRGAAEKRWIWNSRSDLDGSEMYQRLCVYAYFNEKIFDGFVYANFDDPEPTTSYITKRSPIRDVGSPGALARARQDIDNCTNQHECCKNAVPPTGSRLLPKRLVDCIDLSRPRLASPNEKHIEYLALSYVWGEDQVHKTTKSNVSTYECGIAPSLLPPTIYDAIRVTHMLGFRWLWVDSLCIIQDSDEDKLHEIGRMHHIYRCAHLTIMAASANSAQEGFLQQRSHPYGNVTALPFILPPQPPTSAMFTDSHLRAQSKVGEVYLASISSARTSYSENLGLMSTRAWCMQEYLMSPRALIFTKKTLLFRCRTTTQGVGNSLFLVNHELRLPDSLFLQDPPMMEPGSKEWKDTHTAWMGVVRDYSLRVAKEDSDKLVACGAVAEQFHRVLGSDYFAGMWRSDMFLADLLWMAPSRHCTRPTTYRAPSWSWAAVEGSINPFPHTLTFEDPRTVVLVEVVECRVTLEDPSIPFGRVTGGTLALRGALIPIHGGSATRWSQRSWSVPLPSFEQMQRQKWSLSGLTSDEEGDTPSIDPENPTVHRAIATFDCDADELPGRFWVLPFVRTKSGRKNYKSDHIYGIVLEQAPPSGDEKIPFRRIGTIWSYVTQDKAWGADPHPLWDPLTGAAKLLKDRGLPWMDIDIV